MVSRGELNESWLAIWPTLYGQIENPISQESERKARLFAADVVERVLPIIEHVGGSCSGLPAGIVNSLRAYAREEINEQDLRSHRRGIEEKIFEDPDEAYHAYLAIWWATGQGLNPWQLAAMAVQESIIVREKFAHLVADTGEFRLQELKWLEQTLQSYLN